jgi:hypothetical protein
LCRDNEEEEEEEEDAVVLYVLDPEPVLFGAAAGLYTLNALLTLELESALVSTLEPQTRYPGFSKFAKHFATCVPRLNPKP